MHINFAPEKKFEFDLKTLKRLKLTRKNMVASAGIIIAFMFLFGLAQKGRISLLASNKERLEALNKSYQEEAQKKGLNVAQTAGKTPAIRAFQERISWSEVLYDVSQAVSSSVWLEGFAGTSKDRKLQLSGEASDHSTVAGFVSALSKIPRFADVSLVSSNVSTDSKITKIKFQIECKLKL